MANRSKRRQQEAERLLEAEKIKAAFRRIEITPKVSRIRKRMPEHCIYTSEAISQMYDFYFQSGKGPIGEFADMDAFVNYLKKSRPLLRALIQKPEYAVWLMIIYDRVAPCRPTNTWRPPKSSRPERIMESYLLHRFVRYQCSWPLMRTFLNENESFYLNYHFSHFAHMASGGSFRKMPGFEGWFTAKMGHYLLHAPKTLTWEDAIARAYLCGLGLSKSVQKILHICKDEHYFIICDKQQPLWRFLLRYPDISDKDVSRIITFCMHQTKGNHTVINEAQGISIRVEALYPGFNIQGATPASVLRKVDAWEAHLKAIIHKPYTAELPVAEGVKGIEYFLPGKVQMPLVIRQITRPLDLIREGRAMRHCVASYLDGCIKGKWSIWVVRMGESRLATIELRPDKKIYQVKGRFNETPAEPVFQAVKAWCRQESLKLIDY